MEKILLIVFCVLCFAGMIAAEIFASGGAKKPSDKKSDQKKNEDDHK